LLWLWAAAIAASTVLTHQHHIIDAVTGWALGVIAFTVTAPRAQVAVSGGVAATSS
jgi:membrane-associated phospholipid phosphatase